MLIIIDLYSCAYDGNDGINQMYDSVSSMCSSGRTEIRYETLSVKGCPLLLGRVCAKSMLISRGSGASRMHPN